MIQFTPENFKKINACGIYKIIIKEHFYIGSSKDIKKRMREHYRDLEKQRHHNIFFQRCYNKYGLNNIYFDIVEICDEESLIEREAFYIKSLNPDINSIINPTKPVQNKLSVLRQNIKRKNKSYLQRKVVYKYAIDGKYLDTYESVTEAAYFNNTQANCICAVCNGRQFSAKGYRYSYEYKEKLEPRQSKAKLKDYYLIKDKHNKKYVYQYNLDGEYLDEFCSAFEAELNTGINHSSISQCCRMNGNVRSAGGFLWRYFKTDLINKYENKSSKAKIKCINILDIYTLKEFEFESIAEAVRQLKINHVKFDCACSNLSYAAIHKSLYRKKYLVKYKDDNYNIPKNLRESARVKLRESGKVFE